MPMSKQQLSRRMIQSRFAHIEDLNGEIQNIAKKVIPDFHFLSHKVSTFWTCDESPIGLCVWNLDEAQFNINCLCRYCGGPVERK